MVQSNGWPVVELELVDVDEDQVRLERAMVYGGGTEPAPELNPQPREGPTWQYHSVTFDKWIFVSTSVAMNYTLMSWQFERLWSLDEVGQSKSFRAAHVLLDWYFKNRQPLFAIALKIVLQCPRVGPKVWMFLVQPWGTPPRWETFEICPVRRLVFDERHGSYVPHTCFPHWEDQSMLRHLTEHILKWLPLANPRLSDLYCGRFEDLFR